MLSSKRKSTSGSTVYNEHAIPLIGNSAGLPCSITSVQPPNVNVKAVASHHHVSNSIVVPRHQLQGVLSQPMPPLPLQLSVTSPPSCSSTGICRTTLGTGGRTSRTLKDRACSYLIDFRLLSIASGGIKFVAT